MIQAAVSRNLCPVLKDIHIRRALDSLRRIVRILRVTDRETERKMGISVAQLFVLRQLAGGGLSMNELARATLTDPSSVSVIVKRLTEADLVHRSVSPNDGRRAIVTLTHKGKGVLKRAPVAPQALILKGLASLKEGSLRSLAKSLEQVARTMGSADPVLFFEHEPPVKRRH